LEGESYAGFLWRALVTVELDDVRATVVEEHEVRPVPALRPLNPRLYREEEARLARGVVELRLDRPKPESAALHEPQLRLGRRLLVREIVEAGLAG